MGIIIKLFVKIGKSKGGYMRKHWVTTLMGALAAAANLVGNYVLSSGKILWSNIILSFFLFAIGAFAADYRQVDKVKK